MGSSNSSSSRTYIAHRPNALSTIHVVNITTSALGRRGRLFSCFHECSFLSGREPGTSYLRFCPSAPLSVLVLHTAMGLLKLFKKKSTKTSSSDSVNGSKSTQNSSPASINNQKITDSNSDSTSVPQISTPLPTPQQEQKKSSRKSSFGILRKPSFNHDSNLNLLQQLNNNNELPEELVPVVTLINHQQSRSYYKGNSYYYDSSKPLAADGLTTTFNWMPVYLELNGNDITVEIQNSPSTIINICDCELNYNKNDIILTVTVSNQSIMYFRFNTLDELNSFYSSVLLCKFEYQQLQEAYTGALLSSQAIHFSDIKTLLSPNNKSIKKEWCVIRFPFLNDKWIRCLVVVKPNNKIEIYTHSNKSKKNLLSTITNGLSCYTIYPNDPTQVNNNSLLRVNGNCYINSELLTSILNDESMSSLTNESINSKKNFKNRSRTNSLNKRLSIQSLRSSKSHDSSSAHDVNNNSTDMNSNFSHPLHQRVTSIDTTVSDNSFSNSKTPKKLSKKDLVKTHLVYIIPESHPSVKPCEIMLRMLIPVLNSFSLYGRPTKFISSRTDKNSLLFGLPQLPNTYYLNNTPSLDLINLNIDNSITENWSSHDWNLIFKELLSALMAKGWKGGSYQGDLTHLNISLNMDKHHFNERNQSNDYDPMEDFIDRASSNANRSNSLSVSVSAAEVF